MKHPMKRATIKPSSARLLLIGAAAAVLTTAAVGQDSFNSPPPQRPGVPAGTPAATPPGGESRPPPSGYELPKPPPQRPGAGTAASGNERQDFGVAASDRLHAGPMHGPTPTSIPGAQTITTPALVDLMKAGAGRVLVFDVLGSQERLPGALNAVPAHQAGSFDDAVQREFGQYLQQVTQGQKDTAMVFYCQSTMCWMSYNAALRASRMGYRKVLWYRGGVEAWKAGGQALQGPGPAGR